MFPYSVFNAAVYKQTPWTKCSQSANSCFTALTVISLLDCWFWQLQKFSVGCSPPNRLQCFKQNALASPVPLLPPIPKFCQPSAASAQPAEPVVPLRMPGAAGAAETGVVRVGAKSGVNYQLAVGKLRLVHAFWRHIRTCNSRVNTFVLLNLKGHSVWLSG